MEQELCLKDGKIRDQPRRPRIRMDGPDGGWAWAVAFSACVISFIMAGLGRMSGILYVAFMECYGVDRLAASAPFSIRASTRNLLGPVVGILGQKYGVRLVTICGGVMATLSASLCFFAPDIIWVTVLWGIFNGVGVAMSVTLPQVVVGHYFEKYTTTATGMTFSGGCVGAFLFPVLLEQLLHEYGMQGTFLVIGGIIMHTVPAAMILRKPPWLKGKTRNNNEEGSDCLCKDSDVKKSLLEDEDGSESREKVKGIAKIENGVIKSSTKDFPDVRYLHDHKRTVLKILTAKTSADRFLSVTSTPAPTEDRVEKELEDLLTKIQDVQRKSRFSNVLKVFRRKEPPLPVKPLSEQKSQSFQFAISSEFDMCDVYKTCSVPDIYKETRRPSYVAQKLKDIRESPSDVASRFPEEDQQEVLQILSELGKVHDAIALMDRRVNSSDDDDLPPGTTPPLPSSSNTFSSHLLTALRLHSNPIFLLICLCRSVHFITLVPVMTIIVDFLMDKGLREEDGKWGIAVLSLGDLLGRLGFGWVTDGGHLTLARYMLVAMVMQGVSTACLPLMQGWVALYAMLCAFGLLQGTLFVRHNVLVSKYMDDGEQSIAMGCMNFFSGVLGFGLPAYIGYFRDTLGTYSYLFYINGAINFLTGLLWILEPYLLPCSVPKPKTNESPTPV